MAKKSTSKTRNPKHAPQLLHAMTVACQEMRSSSDWLRLASMKRHAKLGLALAKYAPDAKTPHAFGPALHALAGRKFTDADGEEFELVERYFAGDSANRYGVQSRLRERILKTRATALRREATIDVTAKAIAKQLRRGQPVPSALLVESTADRSVRQAREVAQRGGWDLPVVAQPQPVPVPPVVIEPIASSVDNSNLPGAWRKHGRPSYRTQTHLAADEHFDNRRVVPGGTAAERGDLKAADAANLHPRSPVK